MVAAVKAAGPVETLKGDGPFTLFAPTNAAFNKLPKGTVGNLLKPENKAILTFTLTYHVVSGKIDFKELMKMLMNNSNTYTAITAQGGKLTFMMKGKGIQVKDEKGNVTNVTIKDVYQKNSVIHVIDTVLMP